MKITNGKLSSVVLVGMSVFTFNGCFNNGSNNTATTELYGTMGYGEENNSSAFIKLNATTGELIEIIGDIGYQVNGLEYDGTTDTFFATTTRRDATCAGCLITIDASTGAGTEIGSSGFEVVLNPTVNSAGEMYGWTEDSDSLVQFDKTTGEATQIGDSEISTWSHGLAFNADDVLILYNGYSDIWEINTTSGEGELIRELNEVDADYAHHGDFDLSTGLYAGITSPEEDNRSVVFKDSDFNTTMTSEHNITGLHTLTFKNK